MVAPNFGRPFLIDFSGSGFGINLSMLLYNFMLTFLKTHQVRAGKGSYTEVLQTLRGKRQLKLRCRSSIL